MKKTTLLGCMLAMTVWLVPLGLAEAWGTHSHPPMSTTTVSIPVWDFTGIWSGTANGMSKDYGHFENVPVTIKVNGPQSVDSKGKVYFRGTVTISPPVGTGYPASLIAIADIKDTTKLMQKVMVMWSGDNFIGCGMGTSMTMPSSDSSAMMIHGCMHFESTGNSETVAIADTPAMVIVDLVKQ